MSERAAPATDKVVAVCPMGSVLFIFTGDGNIFTMTNEVHSPTYVMDADGYISPTPIISFWQSIDWSDTSEASQNPSSQT